jgi:hypothetical protein
MGSLARVFGPAAAGLLYNVSISYPFLLAAGLTTIAGGWMIGIRRHAHRTPPAETPQGFEVESNAASGPSPSGGG